MQFFLFSNKKSFLEVLFRNRQVVIVRDGWPKTVNIRKGSRRWGGKVEEGGERWSDSWRCGVEVVEELVRGGERWEVLRQLEAR
jgi:hypothetical protein